MLPEPHAFNCVPSAQYFPTRSLQEVLENTPSRQHGITAEQEQAMMRTAINMIIGAGAKLQMWVSCSKHIKLSLGKLSCLLTRFAVLQGSIRSSHCHHLPPALLSVEVPAQERLLCESLWCGLPVSVGSLYVGCVGVDCQGPLQATVQTCFGSLSLGVVPSRQLVCAATSLHEAWVPAGHSIKGLTASLAQLAAPPAF